MKQFVSAADVPDFPAFLHQARQVKQTPHAWKHLGTHRTIGLIFMNPSLRTRLSTQKAALNLGMAPMVMNIDKDGWKLATGEGVVMNGDAAEHVKDAVAVMGQYCDIIGVRSFPLLVNREEDYAENIIGDFLRYAGVPIVSLESATRHPLQSAADLVTIEQFKTTPRPKVVLTWAPHPRALPQAVPNSFAEWMCAAGVDLTIAHPEGYELDKKFTQGAKITHDQDAAFRGADFIYAKNWSSYHEYGQILCRDKGWMVSREKMHLTNNAKFMHCLPVRRNVVVEDAVIDSPNSIVIPQAANRVVAAQVVLKRMLEAMR
jgi:N-succinyl-L-ornithine transcarbamylase